MRFGPEFEGRDDFRHDLTFNGLPDVYGAEPSTATEVAPMHDPIANQSLELVACPDCGSVASIEWQTAIAGVSYLKVRCVARHWFFLPAHLISAYPTAEC